MSDKEFVFKCAILGSAGVGKSSLINRYVDRKFSEDYKPTLGASIIAKDVDLVSATTRYKVRLVLWDIAGQEKYESVRAMYFQGCVGAILCYDVTRLPSFQEVEFKWLKDFRTYAMQGSAYLLIGNKSDLEDMRKVSTDEGKGLAGRINASAFIETSAKTGENVNECFSALVKTILRSVGEKI
jgi:small GTP-binding protein